jgi:hypothetical protein
MYSALTFWVLMNFRLSFCHRELEHFSKLAQVEKVSEIMDALIAVSYNVGQKEKKNIVNS